MPPKSALLVDQAQERVLAYDLRKKKIPQADPPPAPGWKQANTSRDNKEGEEDKKEEEDEAKSEAESEAESDKEDNLPAPAPAPVAAQKHTIQSIADIASSDFNTINTHADTMAAEFYIARENYKKAQHKVLVTEKQREYMNTQHNSPMTSDAEEALEEAMRSSNFLIETSLQLYTNKKKVTRKVLTNITRKS
ncbi:hypothetical protein BJY01DRAFT_253287 [Aspergillus pseudoustus]|uniref:Uncharacterized protein n=1 Tax=Aspergillus pseudoustus TaxID=1810923 RepID=A0ABR4J1V2_9EURO